MSGGAPTLSVKTRPSRLVSLPASLSAAAPATQEADIHLPAASTSAVVSAAHAMLARWPVLPSRVVAMPRATQHADIHLRATAVSAVVPASPMTLAHRASHPSPMVAMPGAAQETDVRLRVAAEIAAVGSWIMVARMVVVARRPIEGAASVGAVTWLHGTRAE
jgi:hypothetical protein